MPDCAERGAKVDLPIIETEENSMWDIIPDIHGQADKLTGLLRGLGYAKTRGAWRHPDPDRTVVFLGDFIDRGPENARVIGIVRGMIDAGTAQAVMGNHELNAIHFHTDHYDTGEPLRGHNSKNRDQHKSFLAEYPIGSVEADEAIAWMRSLPLFLDLGGFRVVHACWSDTAVSSVLKHIPDARLTEDAVQIASDTSSPLWRAIETLTKGPEAPLPAGYSFFDKGDHERSDVRLAWWREGAVSWRDNAVSVPNPDKQLPDIAMPISLRPEPYPSNSKTVFFGHYWMRGEVLLQSHNALCLDYSAGNDGPLLAYTVDDPAAALDLKRITAFSG